MSNKNMGKIAGSLFVLSLFVLAACNSSKKAEKSNKTSVAPTQTTQKITYIGYVKGILDNDCIMCHHGSAHGAPGDFRTYAGVKPYLSHFQKRVISDHADMPKGNAPLSKTVRDNLAKWIADGAPEK